LMDVRKYILGRRPHKIAVEKFGVVENCAGWLVVACDRCDCPSSAPVYYDREVHYQCRKCGHVAKIPREMHD